MKIFKKSTNNNLLFNDTLTLNEIANFYETDKGTADKSTLSWGNLYPFHFCMHYTHVYEKYMFSDKENNFNMLEIGICDKRFPYASPKMWLTYFKNVNLFCVDNFWGEHLKNKLEDVKKLNAIGVNFIYADQGSYDDWDKIKKLKVKYKYIVEDGSHWPNHMMVTMWKCIDLVESNGYYFMEDIQNPEKSRGWYKYDNSLISEELLETQKTKIFKSSFLNDKQNKDINNNFELIDLVLDPNNINYLGVFKKK
jgi:hypothetical protein